MITDVKAYHADKKDSQYLQDATKRLKQRLKGQGLLWTTLLADAGYSSGENYAFLEKENIISYIPQHGTYKGGPEGFIFFKEENYWLCPMEKKVTFRKRRMVKNSLQDDYLTKRSDCKNCPMKQKCIGKGFEKKIRITVYVDEYERNNKRVRSKYGRRMKGKRQSTVEPVFGTLTQFMGLRKINTIGIVGANKVMYMSATAYNLKKLLKFVSKKTGIMVNQAIICFSIVMNPFGLFNSFLST